MQPLVLPEGGNNAQQALIQSYSILGVVSHNPVVTGESYEAASSGRGSLQREESRLGGLPLSSNIPEAGQRVRKSSWHGTAIWARYVNCDWHFRDQSWGLKRLKGFGIGLFSV